MSPELRSRGSSHSMSSESSSRQTHKPILPPITTLASVNNRRRSSAQSTTSTTSTLVLPSPSIVAARAYFLEQVTPITPSENAPQRRRSLIEGQQFPRRHSVLSTPGGLVKQLENFSFDSSAKGLTSVEEEVEPKISVEDGEEGEHEYEYEESHVQEGHSVIPLQPRSSRKSVIISDDPAETLRQVPFEFTHGHLRDWGYAYLGNSATADAFVYAVSLRRPSISVDDGLNSSGLVTIRARVVPKDKDRKPFLIQRKFDLQELRSSVLPLPEADEQKSMQPSKLRRSSRSRIASTQHELSKARRGSADHRNGQECQPLALGSIPIHIEYALHYLPVLAALMLSGHVRKGDSIDLPIPHSEAWRPVISYIYTGKVPMTSAMRENILYLGGNVP